MIVIFSNRSCDSSYRSTFKPDDLPDWCSQQQLIGSYLPAHHGNAGSLAKQRLR